MKIKQIAMFVIITLFLGNVAEAKTKAKPAHRASATAVVTPNATPSAPSNLSGAAQATSNTPNVNSAPSVTPVPSKTPTTNTKKGWTFTIPTDFLEKSSELVFGKFDGLTSEVGYRWDQPSWTTNVPDPQFTNDVTGDGASAITAGYYPTTKLGLNVEINFVKETEEIRLLGSSYGQIQISNPISIGGQYYPLGTEKYIYVGWGESLMNVEGHFSTGGYPFPTTGSGWHPYWSIGARAVVYEYKKFALTGNVEYRRPIDNTTETAMPNLFGPGQNGQFPATMHDSVIFGLSVGYSNK